MKKKSYTVKYVKDINDKGYPVHRKGYASAHEAADKVEKKSNPKMYEKEKKVLLKEWKKRPDELAATHDKKGNVKIENKYKKFTPNLIKHERTEWKKSK